MKRINRGQSLFIHVLLLVSLILSSLLALFMINDSQDKMMRLVEDHYTKIAFKILSAYPDFKDMRLEQYGEEIMGMVIIDEEGETLANFGTLAHDPRIFSEYDERQLHISRDEDLIILNIIPELLIRPEERDFLKYNIPFEERRLLLHLEFYDEQLLKKANNSFLQFTLIQSLIILFYLLAEIFYQRGQKLSRKLEEQKKLVLLGTALRTLTHEMKNPLSAIHLQASFLKKKYPMNPESDTQIIFDEVDRLSRLMDTVREYMKGSSGEQNLCSMTRVLKEVRSAFPPEISWTIPDRDIYVDFDRDKLRSVIENLITNAVESGSALSEIDVHCLPMKKTVNLQIKDRGKGISPELQKKIFDPFFTTKIRGSGAGLMIVRKFLDEKRGIIKLESTEGRGTSVSLWLPLLLFEDPTEKVEKSESTDS